jgi:hypothetical protein
MRFLLSAALLGVGLACQAQTAAPAAADPSVPQRGGEPRVMRVIIEDSRVRTEELRVRGITRSLSVQPKLPGVPAYRIGVNTDGRDTTQDRRSEGSAQWQLFAF